MMKVILYLSLLVSSSFAWGWCIDTPRSSFIQEICYSPSTLKLGVQIDETMYTYCGVSLGEATAFTTAPSLGRYFNAEIKGRECY